MLYWLNQLIPSSNWPTFCQVLPLLSDACNTAPSLTSSNNRQISSLIMGFCVPVKSKQGLVTQDCSSGALPVGISVYQQFSPVDGPEKPLTGEPSSQLFTDDDEAFSIFHASGRSS